MPFCHDDTSCPPLPPTPPSAVSNRYRISDIYSVDIFKLLFLIMLLLLYIFNQFRSLLLQLGFNIRGGREHHCGVYVSKVSDLEACFSHHYNVIRFAVNAAV